MMILFLSSLIFGARQSAAFSSGAIPLTVCDSMTPGHSVASQSQTSPFSVHSESAHFIPNFSLEVRLQTTPDISFKGFYCQARTPESKRSGYFLNLDDYENARGHDCSGAAPFSDAHDTISHNLQWKNNPDTHIDFLWQAPLDSSAESISITCTFVKRRVEFWVGVESRTIYPINKESAEHCCEEEGVSSSCYAICRHYTEPLEDNSDARNVIITGDGCPKSDIKLALRCSYWSKPDDDAFQYMGELSECCENLGVSEDCAFLCDRDTLASLEYSTSEAAQCVSEYPGIATCLVQPELGLHVTTSTSPSSSTSSVGETTKLQTTRAPDTFPALLDTTRSYTPTTMSTEPPDTTDTTHTTVSSTVEIIATTHPTPQQTSVTASYTSTTMSTEPPETTDTTYTAVSSTVENIATTHPTPQQTSLTATHFESTSVTNTLVGAGTRETTREYFTATNSAEVTEVTDSNTRPTTEVATAVTDVTETNTTGDPITSAIETTVAYSNGAYIFTITTKVDVAGAMENDHLRSRVLSALSTSLLVPALSTVVGYDAVEVGVKVSAGSLIVESEGHFTQPDDGSVALVSDVVTALERRANDNNNQITYYNHVWNVTGPSNVTRKEINGICQTTLCARPALACVEIGSFEHVCVCLSESGSEIQCNELSDDGLSPGAIAGIVIAVVLLLAFVILLILFLLDPVRVRALFTCKCCKNHPRKKRLPSSQSEASYVYPDTNADSNPIYSEITERNDVRPALPPDRATLPSHSVGYEQAIEDKIENKTISKLTEDTEGYMNPTGSAIYNTQETGETEPGKDERVIPTAPNSYDLPNYSSIEPRPKKRTVPTKDNKYEMASDLHKIQSGKSDKDDTESFRDTFL